MFFRATTETHKIRFFKARLNWLLEVTVSIRIFFTFQEGSTESVTTDHIGGILVGKSPSEVDSVILQSRNTSARYDDEISRALTLTNISPVCKNFIYVVINRNILFHFRALGFLGFCLTSTGDNACLAALDMFVQCLHGALISSSGAAHIVAAMTVTEWASLDKVK